MCLHDYLHFAQYNESSVSVLHRVKYSVAKCNI
jgi:hypothetical protein